ncbi:hypothetical protein KJ657_04540 [Patescibacteria group bacterium]|nr:hypothetical protein [Patescibacteria group bacterium]MBU1016322.1 hypothetical protein [Patescibacteria group bacterium]MBU1685025.1 hypothetical protein [Patescibacteria group bacterium]MBU1938833.1 hypothetical protein [Patescibacteria group bacterium]
MEIFTTILAYGFMFVVGFVLILMVFQILAFYIAGKMTDSINDEVTSAFTLLGAMLVIGAVCTLLNAILATVLSGLLIPGIISLVFYFVVILFAIVKIYELSVGKAILHLIISLIIIAIGVGLLFYLGTRVLPETGWNDKTDVDVSTNVFGVTEDEYFDATEDTEIETDVTEALEEAEELIEELPEDLSGETSDEDTPSKPKLPGSPE